MNSLAKLVARVGPLRGEAFERRDDVVGSAHAHGAGLAAVDPGHRIDEARQRLIEGEVRHHRRDHRAQPNLPVGARDRGHTVDGRDGKLEKQVVAGGGALLHLVDGGDQRRQILVFRAALAAHPWIGCLQDFKVPAVADPLRQSAVTVGVRVDEPGNDETAGCIKPLGVLVSHRAGRDEIDDGVAFDDDIARFAAGRTRGKNPAAGYDQRHRNCPDIASRACKYHCMRRQTPRPPPERTLTNLASGGQ
jgi:hypothetical protein